VGLAKAARARGGVLAIEPQPAIYRITCANLALNALTDVASWQVGCGAQAGSMRVPLIDYQARSLHNSDAAEGISIGHTRRTAGVHALRRQETGATAPQSGGNSLESGGVGLPVSIVPLDELGRDLPSLRLSKVDVEGMELTLPEGARGLIQKHRPLLYVEHDRLEKSQSLIQWILDAQYRLRWPLPPLFNPENYFGVTENIYGPVVSINVFCSPREMGLPMTKTMVEITDPAFHILHQ
jgi:FkbM family methyltransferase